MSLVAKSRDGQFVYFDPEEGIDEEVLDAILYTVSNEDALAESLAKLFSQEPDLKVYSLQGEYTLAEMAAHAEMKTDVGRALALAYRDLLEDVVRRYVPK